MRRSGVAFSSVACRSQRIEASQPRPQGRRRRRRRLKSDCLLHGTPPRPGCERFAATTSDSQSDTSTRVDERPDEITRPALSIGCEQPDLTGLVTKPVRSCVAILRVTPQPKPLRLQSWGDKTSRLWQAACPFHPGRPASGTAPYHRGPGQATTSFDHRHPACPPSSQRHASRQRYPAIVRWSIPQSGPMRHLLLELILTNSNCCTPVMGRKHPI